MNPIEILFKSLDIIIETNLWPDKKPSEVLKILMYVNNKGWLYIPNIAGEIKAVICAYRIKEVNSETLTKMPVNEEGNILYVPFVISMKKDLNLFQIIRESCKIYLENNPNIEEIVLEDKHNKIKRYALKSLV